MSGDGRELGSMDDPRAPVYQYDVYISETSLYDVTRNQLVWAGMAQTTSAATSTGRLRAPSRR